MESRRQARTNIPEWKPEQLYGRTIIEGMYMRNYGLAIVGIVAIAIGSTSPSAYGESEVLDSAKKGMYSADGLYEPGIVRYKNGLTLITKQRDGVRAVSLRVAVGVGMAHYECGQRHVPHFLEHMLFGAIPEMPEEKLERRFFELGATHNAHTYSTETVYELDVFSGTAIEALDLVADMLTKAELEESSFDRTKRVIFQEQGGEPGPVERQTLVGGRLASGERTALSKVSARHFGACGIWDTGQDVSLSSVRDAYNEYYRPDNMVWVVVGDFRRKELLKWADERLSVLRPGDGGRPKEPKARDFGESHFSGYADEPAVSIMVVTEGLASEDYYAHAFIEHLINAQLFERLRTRAALTYTPFAALYTVGNLGVFKIKAEVRYEDRIDTLKIIDQIVNELTDSRLDEELFRSAQLSLLREWARSIETNAEYAEHYVNSLPEYRLNGSFVNEEVLVAALTREAVQRAAKKLFSEERVVYVLDDDRQAEIELRER